VPTVGFGDSTFHEGETFRKGRKKNRIARNIVIKSKVIRAAPAGADLTESVKGKQKRVGRQNLREEQKNQKKEP